MRTLPAVCVHMRWPSALAALCCCICGCAGVHAFDSSRGSLHLERSIAVDTGKESTATDQDHLAVLVPAAPGEGQPAVIGLYSSQVSFFPEEAADYPQEVLAVAFWPDGRVVWCSRIGSSSQGPRLQYGPPYKQGRVDAGVVDKLLDALWRLPLLSDPDFPRAYYTPEFPVAFLAMGDGARCQWIESSLDFFTVSWTLSADTASFVKQWKTACDILLDAIPEDGRLLRNWKLTLVPIRCEEQSMQ